MRVLRTGSLLSLAIILALLATALLAVPALGLVGSISISPTSGQVGTVVHISGTGFTPGSTYTVNFDAAPVATGAVSPGGALATFFYLRASPAGARTITVTTTAPDTSNAITFTVSPQVSVSPASGHVEDSIRITGNGFGASSTTASTTVTIYFDLIAITSTTSTTDGSFVANFVVPQSTGGKHTVTATDSLGNTEHTSYSVIPRITISPSSVAASAPLTINGTGFGTSSAVTIYFDGVAATSTASTTDGSFVVSFVVPQSTSGSHTVTATDSLANTASASYSITPTVTINPSSITVGAQVTINGAGFAASSTIAFHIDSVVINPSAATTNTLGSFTTSSFVIPTIPRGTHTFQAKDSSGNSATMNFAVAQGIRLNPQSGPPGTNVQVTGNGFSTSSSITINFDGTRVITIPSTPSTDSSGSFAASFTVPISSGRSHSVMASDGADSATATYTVVGNATLDPVRGPVGTTATVSGISFASGGAILVTYDTTPVATATADLSGTFSATFNVPASSTGTHTVNVTDRTRNIPLSFSVVPDATLSPASGYVGSSVTVIGTGFASGGTITVRYDATQAAATIADATGGFSATFKAPASEGGNHAVTITDGISTIVFMFAMDSTPPPTPTLLLPTNDTQADALTAFQWTAVNDPSSVTYVLQVARDSNFSVLVVQKTGLAPPEYQLTEPEKLQSAARQQPYYWRVKAIDGASNDSPWTPAQSFYVGFVLATWALYTIFGFAVLIAGLLGFWIGSRRRRAATAV